MYVCSFRGKLTGKLFKKQKLYFVNQVDSILWIWFIAFFQALFAEVNQGALDNLQVRQIEALTFAMRLIFGWHVTILIV
jgi:hypothetical protein